MFDWKAFGAQVVDTLKGHVDRALQPFDARLKELETRSPEKGEKGEPGSQGDRGEPGVDGTPGRDGRDGQPGRDGAPGTDGKDGAPGQDGKDGLGFDDINVEFDGERSFKLIFTRGELRKEFGAFKLPVVVDRGVWKDGAFERGDGVTWGGSFWIAQKNTETKPDTPGSDWRLAVKRGRDGKDGKPGERGAPGARGDKGEPGPRGFGG